jgi:ammonia channel protein AmtB
MDWIAGNSLYKSSSDYCISACIIFCDFLVCFQIAALGGFILFFGFLAFNGGSQLTISNAGDGAAVAISVVNTIISASFAAFSSLIINRLHIFGNTWSLLVTINGALTGMASISQF